MKLLLADDHTLFRDALIQYIERAEPTARVALAKDFFEAESALQKDNSFDLVLLDLRMPGMNGLQGLKTVREKFPQTRVALMSGVAEKNDVEEALKLGAMGYFPKTLSGRSLIKAIQLVLAGEKFIPIEHSSNQVMPSYYADKNVSPLQAQTPSPAKSVQSPANVSLTPREREVLHYLLQGSSNKEIATQLSLQEVTVKLHVRGICRKLDAKNRTQAALKAREMGLS